MFRLGTTDLNRAIKRALALHPKVKCVVFGLYVVTGSAGDTYIVRCWREQTGKSVDCSCKTRGGSVCKHSVAAIPLHSHMARTRLSR